MEKKSKVTTFFPATMPMEEKEATEGNNVLSSKKEFTEKKTEVKSEYYYS